MLVFYQNCEIVKNAGGCFWKNRLLWVFSGEGFFHLVQFSLLSKEYNFCCLSKKKESGNRRSSSTKKDALPYFKILIVGSNELK